MLKEKLINNLIKQAEEVKVKIPEDKITEIPLEEFYKLKGEVYYSDNIFYKKGTDAWFMTKIGVSEEEPEIKKPEEKEIKEQISQELVKWCSDLKNYVDFRLKEIEEKNNEGLRELKEYVDNVDIVCT